MATLFDFFRKDQLLEIEVKNCDCDGGFQKIQSNKNLQEKNLDLNTKQSLESLDNQDLREQDMLDMALNTRQTTEAFDQLHSGSIALQDDLPYSSSKRDKKDDTIRILKSI